MGGHMHWTKWKEDIDKVIADVCIQIIKEPLTYFSEADIQQLLVEGLRKTELGKSYPTSVLKGKGAKSAYKTSLLHREYAGGGGTRIDIVIFDPKDVRKIDDVNLKSEKKYLDPVYAFELGTEKTSGTVDHINKDFTKLSKCVKPKGTGYIIHFYKDFTKAATGTISRDKTEEKILKEFKQAFVDIKEKFNEIFSIKQTEQIANVKILAILLRTYRNQKKMRGKCEIFVGDKWIKTNVSRDVALRDAILKQLKCPGEYYK
jgi:hypothetical protein